MTISGIIKKLENAPTIAEGGHTKDNLEYGNPEQECTGIVTTCFPSVDVIRKAAAMGANFIVCHERPFYIKPTDTAWLREDAVFQAKKKLLDDANIVIWRYHDHIHGGSPLQGNLSHTDMIFYGVMKVLGWEAYVTGDPSRPLTFRLPETTVRKLARELIEKMHLNGIRVLGDIDATISTVFVCGHLFGTEADHEVIRQSAAGNYDVLLPLELVDYTLGEYIRDSAQLGMPKAILSMGHFNFEEPGMQYMVQWLPQLTGNIPVSYVASGDGFQYIV
jgi:Uncharacterized conserved protein